MATRQAEALALVARARKVGWKVTNTGDGYRVKCPNGMVVPIHLTPSDRHSNKNTLQDLVDNGLADAEAKLAEEAEKEKAANLAAEKERNEKRTAELAKRSAAIARAAGKYGTPEVPIGELLALHPAPVVWLKVHVTPEMADAMLERNTHNRPESQIEVRDWEALRCHLWPSDRCTEVFLVRSAEIRDRTDRDGS